MGAIDFSVRIFRTRIPLRVDSSAATIVEV